MCAAGSFPSHPAPRVRCSVEKRNAGLQTGCAGGVHAGSPAERDARAGGPRHSRPGDQRYKLSAFSFPLVGHTPM